MRGRELGKEGPFVTKGFQEEGFDEGHPVSETPKKRGVDPGSPEPCQTGRCLGSTEHPRAPVKT